MLQGMVAALAAIAARPRWLALVYMRAGMYPPRTYCAFCYAVLMVFRTKIFITCLVWPLNACRLGGRASRQLRFFWLRYLARAETYLAVPGAKTQIVLDLNHELAGQTLTFDVELMKLTKARRSRKAAAMPWLPVPSTDPASGAGITSLPT